LSWSGPKWRVLVLGARWDKCYVPIYEASGRGRRIPLLKTLMVNSCRNECLYCALRCRSARQKAAWEPLKLARVAMRLWREGRIEGIFLSSSIPSDPDSVVELELEATRALRDMGFTGYVHLRLMPGTSRYLVEEAVRLADRVGVNLEAPTRDMFNELCPDKGSFREDVLKRLSWAKRAMDEAHREGKAQYGACRAGLDTQMIVGALEDSDLEFLVAMDWLYRELGLRRVYLSPFRPIKGTPLEAREACSLKRVLRLYQASFLLRDYGIRLDELVDILGSDGRLPDEDPKAALARAQAGRFPLDPNVASYWELLRVPGIGPSSAKRILALRSSGVELRDFWDLVAILGQEGARRAMPYLDLGGPSLSTYTSGK